MMLALLAGSPHSGSKKQWKQPSVVLHLRFSDRSLTSRKDLPAELSPPLTSGVTGDVPTGLTTPLWVS